MLHLNSVQNTERTMVLHVKNVRRVVEPPVLTYKFYPCAAY